MGRYSRKDMIEFAKFAKSWTTPRKVEQAYEHYLKGTRLGKKLPEPPQSRIIKEPGLFQFKNK